LFSRRRLWRLMDIAWKVAIVLISVRVECMVGSGILKV
jgi:hypothetical protein